MNHRQMQQERTTLADADRVRNEVSNIESRGEEQNVLAMRLQITEIREGTSHKVTFHHFM